MDSTEIKFTSVDYYINKFPDKIKEPVIDLEKLATNFSLEGQFDKLEYSEKIGKGSVEKLINRPPIGPIPNNFMCTFCLQYGPDFHLVNCPNPNKRSLVLTFKGFKDLLKKEYALLGNHLDPKNWRKNAYQGALEMVRQ